MATKRSTRYGSMVVVFLTCFRISVGVLSVDKVWKTNCFKETDSGRCEDSWIKISSGHYVCDMVVELAAPPKRIGYVDGDILAAVGSQTFVVQNNTLKLMSATRLFPPRDKIVDKRGNRYYAAEGTTYMAESETKKEIEILTTGEYSVNQLAIDKDSGELVILSIGTQSETNERAGSLFVLNTETINVAKDNVQAEKVDGTGDDITAMAVEGDSGMLLLGTRTPQGGKLVRLTKQEGNPCSETTVGKAAIVDVIKETQDRLLKIFDDISVRSAQVNSPYSSGPGKSPKSLVLENVRLKRDLQVTTAKLSFFTEKLFTFNSHLKSVQMKIIDTNNVAQGSYNYNYNMTEAIEHIGDIEKIGYDAEDPTAHVDITQTTDYPSPDENKLKTDCEKILYEFVPISEFKMVLRTNSELKDQLGQLSLNVEDLLKETNSSTVWKSD